MSQKISALTKTQLTYLGTLQQASDRIIKTQIPVLPPLVDDTELAAFTTRLRALPGRVTSLLTDSLVVINDNLPESNAASALTRDDAKPPSVASVQLNSSLLDPKAPKTEVGRVCTLLHEVSHTLLEPTGFPVKDYAYANCWAITQLGPLSPFNADTYAEVVALMAEAEVHKPNLYRSLSIPWAQQAVFQSLLFAGAASLSTALALVDLRINRAWIRATDYTKFATLEGDLPSDVGSLELKVIEVQLQSWKIIGERTGYFSWTVGLDKESRAQAKALEDVIERVKSWLISLRVQLDAVAPTLLFGVDDTAGIKFNPIRRLSVPRAQLSHIPAAKLADDILVIMLNEAIATSGMTDGKKALLRQHGLDVVNFFVLHDRKQERELLANRLRDLGAVQVTTALTDATWRDLQIGADVAALDVIAEKWKRGVALLDSPGYKEAPKLEGIHPRDVDTVKALMADLTTFALPGNDPRALARDNAVATLKKASSDLVTAFANDKKNGKEIQDLTTKMLAVL